MLKIGNHIKEKRTSWMGKLASYNIDSKMKRETESIFRPNSKMIELKREEIIGQPKCNNNKGIE